jgi:hypothetical protein
MKRDRRIHAFRRAIGLPALAVTVCLLSAVIAGCAKTSGGGPEVLPKRYPGGRSPGGAAAKSPGQATARQ